MKGEILISISRDYVINTTTLPKIKLSYLDPCPTCHTVVDKVEWFKSIQDAFRHILGLELIIDAKLKLPLDKEPMDAIEPEGG